MRRSRALDRAIGIIRDGHFWRHATDVRIILCMRVFSWLRVSVRARLFESETCKIYVQSCHPLQRMLMASECIVTKKLKLIKCQMTRERITFESTIATDTSVYSSLSPAACDLNMNVKKCA